MLPRVFNFIAMPFQLRQLMWRFSISVTFPATVYWLSYVLWGLLLITNGERWQLPIMSLRTATRCGVEKLFEQFMCLQLPINHCPDLLACLCSSVMSKTRDFFSRWQLIQIMLRITACSWDNLRSRTNKCPLRPDSSPECPFSTHLGYCPRVVWQMWH